MIITFETTDYGKIECDMEKKTAYFFKDDLEAPIINHGMFTHPMTETEFMINDWKSKHTKRVYNLAVKEWQTIKQVTA